MVAHLPRLVILTMIIVSIMIVSAPVMFEWLQTVINVFMCKEFFLWEIIYYIIKIVMVELHFFTSRTEVKK